MPFADVGAHSIEYERLEVASASRPTLVLLHEGLGSIAMWRDFPSRVAHATGCNALVYSRYGYGNSAPLQRPREVRYMHDEALLALPELLGKLDVVAPILLGHSDGGSIALIHAGARVRPVIAVVTLAAHVMVEDISVTSIAAAKIAYETTDLRARLARYHADVDSAFWGWNRIWLHPDFRSLEHRGISAAHRLSGARDPGRGRRIRDDGADEAHRGAGPRRRAAGTRGLPAFSAQGPAAGGARRGRAVRRSGHRMTRSAATRTPGFRSVLARGSTRGRHAYLRRYSRLRGS